MMDRDLYTDYVTGRRTHHTQRERKVAEPDQRGESSARIPGIKTGLALDLLWSCFYLVAASA